MNKDQKKATWEKLLPEVQEARKRGDLLSDFLHLRDMTAGQYNRIKPNGFKWQQKKVLTETDIPKPVIEKAPPKPEPKKSKGKAIIIMVNIENLSDTLDNLK